MVDPASVLPASGDADRVKEVAAAFPCSKTSGETMSEKIPARMMPATIFALSGRSVIRSHSVSISLRTGRMISQRGRRQIGHGRSVQDLPVFVEARAMARAIPGLLR